MEKIIYENPELIELDSILSFHGDSSCTDGFSEGIGGGDACPEGADEEDEEP